MNKMLKVGIASVPQQRARSLAIAAGTHKRGADEPHVWFPTVAAMARVLSDENMALLKALREQQPDSMDSLAKVVGNRQDSLFLLRGHEDGHITLRYVNKSKHNTTY